MQTVRRLSKPDQVLQSAADTATTKNPAWWFDDDPHHRRPTPSREVLHNRLIAEVRAAAPDVVRGRRAVVLAGPPGAGKSTVLHSVLGSCSGEFLVIDPDVFKRGLLREALEDGSYDSWLVPREVRDLEAQGERFFPLEFAALVHLESVHIADSLRRDALEEGVNIVIDSVLGYEHAADRLGALLEGHGYDFEVVDVEVPFELSEKRIRERWEEAYRKGLSGADPLGGRWVPSEFARSVFDHEGASLPRANALRLAEVRESVLRYRVYYTSMEQAQETGFVEPSLEVDRSRAYRGAPLLDTVTISGRAAK